MGWINNIGNGCKTVWRALLRQFREPKPVNSRKSNNLFKQHRNTKRRCTLGTSHSNPPLGLQNFCPPKRPRIAGNKVSLKRDPERRLGGFRESSSRVTPVGCYVTSHKKPTFGDTFSSFSGVPKTLLLEFLSSENVFLGIRGCLGGQDFHDSGRFSNRGLFGIH